MKWMSREIWGGKEGRGGEEERRKGRLRGGDEERGRWERTRGIGGQGG